MNKLSATVLLLLIGGCATPTPHYDSRFGSSVREAKSKMIINPNAGNNLDQVSGMDGNASKEAITLYQQSYKSPPPAVNVINIGGAITGAR